MSEDLVLVTGGSGFVATHCIDQLLRAGYKVRTTVRSLAREPDVRATLTSIGAPPNAGSQLCRCRSWRRLRLGRRRGRLSIRASCSLPHFPRTYRSMRTNSSFRHAMVLFACCARLVTRTSSVSSLTSSFVAVGYGHKPRNEPFTEADLDRRYGPQRRSLLQIEDHRRTCRLGLHRTRRRQAPTQRDQPYRYLLVLS